MATVSKQEEPFTYDALERPDSFRLLKVSVSDAGELSCELVHTGLTAQVLPKYSTLSYVWGNPLMERPIICNGRRKLITATLETALIHVTQHNPHEYLWADQICINQLNGEERSQQVNIMGAIFQVSRFVIAFLGPETGNTAAAHGLITRISDIAERMDEDCDWSDYNEGKSSEKLTDNRNITMAESEDLGISFASSKEWNALYSFFDNPWFERIWVVQEMLPCQVQGATDKIESLAVIGSHVLWWDAIKYAAKWISYKGENRPEPENGTPKVDGLSLVRSMQLRFKSRSAQGYSDGTRGKFNYRTLDLLNSFRDRDATDPRDKVYGLLGLSDLQEKTENFGYRPKMKVDYTKTVLEVYRDLARAIIDSKKNLKVLLSATPRSEEAHWPTWIPDWRVRDISDAPVRLPHRKPGGDIPFQVMASPSIDILRVAGKILGSARFVHSEHHVKDVVWFVDARVLRQQIIHMMGQTYQPTGQDVGTAFTLILSTGRVFRSVQDAGTSIQQFADLVLDFIAELKLPRDTQQQRDYRYSRTAKFKPYGFDGSWLNYYQSSLCERRIFVTDTGYMGLGDHHMIEGDIIAILFGLPVACVLRPVVGRAVGYYEFVGEAYVHGGMDGEMVRDLPTDAESGLVIGDEFLLV